MVGWPGETMRDIMASANIIRECKPDKLRINPVILYPGTQLYLKALEKRIIDDRFWEQDKSPVKYLEARDGLKGRIICAFFELLILCVYLLYVTSLQGIWKTFRRKIKDTFTRLKITLELPPI